MTKQGTLKGALKTNIMKSHITKIFKREWTYDLEKMNHISIF